MKMLVDKISKLRNEFKELHLDRGSSKVKKIKKDFKELEDIAQGLIPP